MLFLSLFVLILMFLCLIFLIISLINSIYYDVYLWFSLLFIIIILLTFIFISLFAIDRLSYKIYFDGKNLIKSGFFSGIHYKYNINEIKKIITATYPREGEFIVIIDNCSRSYDTIYKNSYIRFPYNEKNIKFLRTFCGIHIDYNVNIWSN